MSRVRYLTPAEAQQVHAEVERGAACRSISDPDIMLESPGLTNRSIERVAQAKAVCAGCGVRALCLEWALATRQSGGTLGGMDEKERAELFEQMSLAARGGVLRPVAV